MPKAVDLFLKNDSMAVDVLQCTDNWFGVTYSEEKPQVKEKLAALIQAEAYPNELFLKCWFFSFIDLGILPSRIKFKDIFTDSVIGVIFID